MHELSIHRILQNSRASQYMRSLIVSCQSIIASVWYDFVLPKILWTHRIVVPIVMLDLLLWRTLLWYSAGPLALQIALPVIACSMLCLTNDAVCLNLFILYHLLGPRSDSRLTTLKIISSLFVKWRQMIYAALLAGIGSRPWSHLYHITLMKMMSPLEHVVTSCIYIRIMSNVREKSDHVTCILFGNVAFISNRIDDVNAKHVVTCCDLSAAYPWKIFDYAKSNKAVDAYKIVNIAFLLY